MSRFRFQGKMCVIATLIGLTALVAACDSSVNSEERHSASDTTASAVVPEPSVEPTEPAPTADTSTQADEPAVEDDMTPYRRGIEVTASRLMRYWMFASYTHTDNINEMFDERYAEYMEQNLQAFYVGDELTVWWRSFENTKGDMDVGNMMDDVSRFSLASQDFFAGDSELERVIYICDYPQHTEQGLPTISSAVRVEIGRESATAIRGLQDAAEHGQWDTVLAQADSRVVDERIVNYLHWIDWAGWETVPAK